jgi:hypothetical protein
MQLDFIPAHPKRLDKFISALWFVSFQSIFCCARVELNDRVELERIVVGTVPEPSHLVGGV